MLSLKELFKHSNQIKIKDRLLETFCPNIPKVDYGQYAIVFPLKDKIRFEDMFGDLEETASKGIDIGGILFNKYTDQVIAYKVKSQKEILEDLVKDFRIGLCETDTVGRFGLNFKRANIGFIRGNI